MMLHCMCPCLCVCMCVRGREEGSGREEESVCAGVRAVTDAPLYVALSVRVHVRVRKCV